jgi:hypothetical protein
MKKKIIAGFILAGTMASISAFKLNPSSSERSAGIYLSLQDYYNHKLTYEFDCSSKSSTLKLNDFFGSTAGYVAINGEKHFFDKTKIFGYQTCDNKVYRFFGKDAYQILDTAKFCLYYRYHQVEKIKGKGLIKEDEYYFSRNAGSPLETLTAANLKAAFPDNHSFHYAIDSQIKSDQDLIAYVSFDKCYKVKYIYNQTLK